MLDIHRHQLMSYTKQLVTDTNNQLKEVDKCKERHLKIQRDRLVDEFTAALTAFQVCLSRYIAVIRNLRSCLDYHVCLSYRPYNARRRKLREALCIRPVPKTIALHIRPDRRAAVATTVAMIVAPSLRITFSIANQINSNSSSKFKRKCRRRSICKHWRNRSVPYAS